MKYYYWWLLCCLLRYTFRFSQISRVVGFFSFFLFLHKCGDA